MDYKYHFGNLILRNLYCHPEQAMGKSFIVRTKYHKIHNGFLAMQNMDGMQSCYILANFKMSVIFLSVCTMKTKTTIKTIKGIHVSVSVFAKI